ncbi:MAG: hypothetical protein ACM34I_00075 [bacterium]
MNSASTQSLIQKASLPDGVIRILFVLFFVSIFISLTVPISDPDFWWHLATGQWMWENQSLMSDDPFTFASDPSESPTRREFIFKQYWLSQLLFYVIYQVAGFHGIILLRALVFTCMFLVLFLLMRKAGAGYFLALLLIYLSVIIVVQEIQYIGDKPQMWTSLFSVALIAVLEAMREDRKWAYRALPALMLLWSNMHGGFIFGDVIILLYALSALLSRSGTKAFSLSSGLALLLSGCNPNGFNAVLVTVPFFFGSSLHSEYQIGIVETQSIFQHARLVAIPKMLPHLTSLFILSFTALVINIRQFKKMRKELLLACILVTVMSAIGIRYIILFIAFASLFTVYNLNSIAERLASSRLMPFGSNARRRILIVLTLLFVVTATARFSWAGIRYTALLSERTYFTDYAGLTSFVKEHRLRGNMFNDYTPGGHLIWSLTPDIKLFIDGRALYLSVFKDFKTVIGSPHAPSSRGPDRFTPVYRKVLDGYNINLVALQGCDSIMGTLVPLTIAIARDNEWAVVYADERAVLFMRDIPETRTFIKTFGLPKTIVYDNVISLARAASMTEHGQMMPYWRYSIAFAYHEKGDNESALFYLNEYLRFAPHDSSAMEIRNKLEAELRAMKGKNP